MTDPKKIALAMAVLKYTVDTVMPAQRELRAEANALLDNKDRVSIKSPVDGTLIGVATKSNPKAKAEIRDHAAFTAWMQENYPDRVSEVDSIPAENMGAAIGYIRAYAPNLLETRREVQPYAVAEVLKLSADAGKPCGPSNELDVPGVEVSTPDGNTSVILEKTPQASWAIEQLITGGHVALDGTVRELTAGGE